MGCHWIRSTLLQPVENCRMVSWIVKFILHSMLCRIRLYIFFLPFGISIIYFSVRFVNTASWAAIHHPQQSPPSVHTMVVLKSRNSSIYTQKRQNPLYMWKYNHFDAKLKAFKNFSSAANFPVSLLFFSGDFSPYFCVLPHSHRNHDAQLKRKK